MTIKKEYAVGDTVWIAGISRNNGRLTQGSVIKILNLSNEGFNDGPHYIVKVSTQIEPLLEIRTWATISQDERGPVGLLRDLNTEINSTIRFINKIGFEAHDDQMPDDPEIDPAIIHAAIDQAVKNSSHPPLNLKDPKPKSKYRPRKRKTT